MNIAVLPIGPKLICIDPAKVVDFWPYVSPLIRRAIEHTGISEFSDIEHDVLNGSSLVWIAWDSCSGSVSAAAVTTIIRAGWRKVCEIVACGGSDRHRWLHLRYQLEDYARQEGCEAMRVLGREGWARAMPDYEMTAVILEKAL